MKKCGANNILYVCPHVFGLVIFWSAGLGFLFCGYVPHYVSIKNMEANGIKNCTLLNSYCENRISCLCNRNNNCEAYYYHGILGLKGSTSFSRDFVIRDFCLAFGVKSADFDCYTDLPLYTKDWSYGVNCYIDEKNKEIYLDLNAVNFSKEMYLVISIFFDSSGTYSVSSYQI